MSATISGNSFALFAVAAIAKDAAEIGALSVEPERSAALDVLKSSWSTSDAIAVTFFGPPDSAAIRYPLLRSFRK
ncbi:unannotated protein [freshwater metagenome]|uniref:Unannotated protein n=1 Tax=freshwater metagenome TaxID=449393 RepID=A0A6J6CI94_9ZZZZ